MHARTPFENARGRGGSPRGESRQTDKRRRILSARPHAVLRRWSPGPKVPFISRPSPPRRALAGRCHSLRVRTLPT
ncbi:hypothetical protein SGL43_04857 [Streptomyces globisporus]|uniref:Uncharacterized protein n=1 Tax=Streptomyces globisporus TaxID=1908 RepID=A0ABM9H2F0_STRGL|nr:hypothetical protein SGL43_04857 [Streptomyces globisporus]